ncbi:VOC family protein [Allokutzneria multivorans]|uniref:VOC family protein n=1 Tax=Allokutzneria multivorans TaxID=1142134 RepID=A0ABP7SM80_9PSEU
MPSTSTPPVGQPCWAELPTADQEATREFYRAVLDWEYEVRRDDQGAEYTIATLFGEPVAGLRPHEGAVRDWTLYLAVADLATGAHQVRRFGGSVLEQPQVVPGLGAKVLVDDPSGATVGLCQPARDWNFTVGLPGSLVWAELVTPRPTLADRFFGAVFGYEQRQVADGVRVDHVVWYVEGESVLARVRMNLDTAEPVPPRWIAHFAIDPDVGFDETLDRARAAGARLRFKPYGSTLGKVVVLSDPLGTRFALIDPSQAVDEYDSPPEDPYDD